MLNTTGTTAALSEKANIPCITTWAFPQMRVESFIHSEDLIYHISGQSGTEKANYVSSPYSLVHKNRLEPNEIIASPPFSAPQLRSVPQWPVIMIKHAMSVKTNYMTPPRLSTSGRYPLNPGLWPI
jgi:hypothetical protein